jgi:alkanesulfonate monooxygenase SsuD/methylene tetrahydromethanopterin reductase-like flavin-dependent oxidoreductase (luciferase family)
MLKIAARYADTWNAFGTVEEIRERNQLLDEYCQEIGRDPNSLQRSLYYWVPKADADPWRSIQAFHDVVGPYMEAGMNQFILDQPADNQIGMVEKVMVEAIPKLRKAGAPDRRPLTGVQVHTEHWHRPQDYA